MGGDKLRQSLATVERRHIFGENAEHGRAIAFHTIGESVEYAHVAGKAAHVNLCYAKHGDDLVEMLGRKLIAEYGVLLGIGKRALGQHLCVAGSFVERSNERLVDASSGRELNAVHGPLTALLDKRAVVVGVPVSCDHFVGVFAIAVGDELGERCQCLLGTWHWQSASDKVDLWVNHK